ncbi:VOC family protein [Agromyces silvae]|uniref:VOC family protein n=1 Tax=Agromyces silvae TaxID=3388266 RepID=UPI00280B596C|nr:VOC family protein [Agromyces protaetiae]
MFRGIATISLTASDLDAAATWYTEVFGIEPYFRVPGYVEFRVGDHSTEVGIIEAQFAGSELSRTAAADPARPAGAVVLWHVDDLDGALAKLTTMGAREWDPVRDRGEGFTTATVVDPFGNVLGVMRNPNYLAVHDGQDG